MKKISIKQNKIKIGEIITKLQLNSFFYILLISTFITSIPTPAIGLGSSTIPTGLICVILSIQLMLGYKKLYLPEFLLNIKIKKSVINKLTTFISKTQKNRKGDNTFFNSQILNKLSGLIIFFNGVLMCIPLIFTNWHPSISTTFISLAHIIKNKNLLVLFYFLSLFMFIGYSLLFYLIIKVVKQYSKNFSLSNLKNFSFSDLKIKNNIEIVLSFKLLCYLCFHFFVYYYIWSCWLLYKKRLHSIVYTQISFLILNLA